MKRKSFFAKIWHENQRIFDLLAIRWGYAVLVLRPLIIAYISVKCWQYFRKNFDYLIVHYDDREIFICGLAIVGSLHVIIAGLQLQKISNQKNIIPLADELRDGKMFLESACVKMNKEIKTLLAIFSLLILVMCAVFPFNHEHTGNIIIFIVMFSLYLVWEMAIELDDQFHGVHKIKLSKVKETYDEKTYNAVLRYLGKQEVAEILEDEKEEKKVLELENQN